MVRRDYPFPGRLRPCLAAVVAGLLLGSSASLAAPLSFYSAGSFTIISQLVSTRSEQCFVALKDLQAGLNPHSNKFERGSLSTAA